jgi:outer membrane PBP1 activator LpoA protein
MALYLQAWQKFPNSMAKHPRLLAFGLDAYRLQQGLPLLAEPIRGVTGNLSRNQQSIVRGLSWYRFENAEIIPE